MNMIFCMMMGMLINAGVEKITPSLKEMMNKSSFDEKIGVIVHLSEKPDFEKIKNLSPAEYIEFLKDFSQNSQKDIIDYLRKNFSDKINDLTPFWIFNGFYMKTTKDVIEKISEREEIEYITYDFKVKIEDVSSENKILIPEWNIIAVRADSCWMIGYTGAGIVIGHMGTGVDVSHPALAGKWISPYWYDAVNGQPQPYDDNGFGTHSIGVILGGDGLGPFQDDIGVAPGAKFVACKCFNSSGVGNNSWIHASFQKFAEWRQELYIVAVYVPFSGPHSLEWWQDMINLRNMGIMPICTWGGGSPGDYEIVLCATPDSLIPGFFIDSLNVKPNIAAPGYNIRSSIPGGGYTIISSRPLAASHLIGAWAILTQADSAAPPCTLWYYLREYAIRPVPPDTWPNIYYGWGWLNIYQALIHLLGINIKENIKIQYENFRIVYKNGKPFIAFSVLDKKPVDLKIFDASGRLVYGFERIFEKGNYILPLNIKSGIYFLLLNKSSKKFYIF